MRNDCLTNSTRGTRFCKNVFDRFVMEGWPYIHCCRCSIVQVQACVAKKMIGLENCSLPDLQERKGICQPYVLSDCERMLYKGANWLFQTNALSYDLRYHVFDRSRWFFCAWRPAFLYTATSIISSRSKLTLFIVYSFYFFVRLSSASHLMLRTRTLRCDDVSIPVPSLLSHI